MLKIMKQVYMKNRIQIIDTQSEVSLLKIKILEVKVTIKWVVKAKKDISDLNN